MSIVSFIFIVIAVLAAVVGTIICYIVIMPKDKEDSDNKLIKFAHDLCNFKKLYIEDIAKGLYIFSTLCSICCGVANLMSGFLSIFFQNHMAFPRLLSGLGLIIIMPILIRVVYEFVMLTILLVQNVIDINGKLKKD